ncbi:PF07457 domain protein [Staphylococcus epidermidis VCU057]|nr:PF07457 domain protein [Staphylococcus epidermidis VCU057]
MALRLFMLLTLISGFWELIEEFMAASNGEGGNHMLLTLKMLCGLAVIAFMEISIAKRKNNRLAINSFGLLLF